MTAQGRYSVDRQRLAELMVAEQTDFAQRHARSRELHERARRSLLAGVPMNWMVRWAGGFPLFVESASGVEVHDVDGHRYIDFCLGDTGAMAGHGPAPTIAAVERQLRRGITHMLPTEDATWVGEELSRRFRASVLAVHPLRDGRQSVLAPPGSRDQRATVDRGARP